MKLLKKATGILAAAAMMGGSFAHADSNGAQENCEHQIEYYDSYGTQALAPAIGLGVIAAVAVAAVAISNTDRGDSATIIDTISKTQNWENWKSLGDRNVERNLSGHLSNHLSGH